MLTFSDLPPPYLPREKIRAMLIAEGITPITAGEITDIACHAVEQAQVTLHRVTDSGSSDDVRMAAFGLAWSIMGTAAEYFKEAAVEAGVALGGKVIRTTVSGGAHG